MQVGKQFDALLVDTQAPDASNPVFFTFPQDSMAVSLPADIQLYPVIAQSDATATIYFSAQFCATFIWEWCLLNSVLSVKYLVIVRALRNASFIRMMKNCNAVTWFWSKPSSLISRRFASKRYLHGTSNPFPQFSSNEIALRASKNAKLP